MKVYEKVCEECKKPFTAKRPTARFCPNTSCRFDNWNKNNPRIKSKENQEDQSVS